MMKEASMYDLLSWESLLKSGDDDFLIRRRL